MIKTNKSTNIAKVSDLLQVISPEPCLEILLAIGAGEACVCHLEAVLGYRQAYISQQLMALREAGLLDFKARWQIYFLPSGKTRNFGIAAKRCTNCRSGSDKRGTGQP